MISGQLAGPYSPSSATPGTAVASRLDTLMEATWLLVIAGVPLLFNRAGEQYFDIYKAALLVLATAFLAALWLVRWTVVPRPAPRGLVPKPLLLPALIFVLLYLVSTAFSVSPSTSFWGSFERSMGTVTVLSLVGFATLLGFNLKRMEQVDRLLWTVATSAGLVALIGVMEWLEWIPSSIILTLDGRIGSTIGHPGFLGAYLMLTIPLTTVQLLLERQRRAEGRAQGRPILEVGLAFSLLIQGLALVLTEARGPWLGFIAMVGVLVLLLGLYHKRRWLLRATVVGGALVVIFFLGTVVPGSPMKGLEDLPYISRATSAFDLDSGSVRSRLVTWEATLELLRDRPVLGGEEGETALLRHFVGYGPETFGFAFDMVNPRELARLGGPQSRMGRAHNLALDSLVATGLLGLGSFLFLIATTYRHSFRALRVARDPKRRLLLIGLLAALTGHLVEKAFGVQEITEQMMFWTLIALFIAVIHLGQREVDPSTVIGVARPPLASRLPGRRIMAVSGALLLCVVGATFAGTTVSADMQSRQGLESATEGNWSGAISAFDSASTLAPYRPRYHWHLYRASFLAAQEQETLTNRARLFNSALYHILRAQELEPVNYYYVLEEARLEAFAALSIHESRDQEAVRLFKLAAQMSPKSVDVLNDWALYEMRNRRLPQALTLLQHSLSLDTEYGITHFLLGHIYSNFGQPDEAVLAFRDAIEYSPSYRDFYSALATSIYSEPQEALGPALRYAEAAPDDPRAHRSLVAIYEALGMGQEAQEHARLADTLSVLQ